MICALSSIMALFRSLYKKTTKCKANYDNGRQNAKSCNTLGVDENLIKFRPSPNFKNMKKFIKSKMDHIEITNRATPNSAPDPPPPPNIGRPERAKPDIQPPLPLDPPPADEPDFLRMQVKKEIEDTDQQSDTSFEYGPIFNSDKSPTLESQGESQSNGKSMHDKTNKSKSQICRDYLRGTCKRQGTCKFAHRYDVSQLEGLYTFCHKYQNSVCTIANCRYVHADVFEERHFYRTGFLPPHALAHHKKVLPLPPPPPPPPEEPPVVLPPIPYTNPPPPIPERENNVVNVIPHSSVANRVLPDVLPQQPYRSTMKREWSNLEGFGSSPRDIDSYEHLPKKCKHCDILEFRLQYIKEKVDKLKQSKDDITVKLVEMDRRSDKLYSLLMALVKPPVTPKANGILSIHNGENREKTLLDQLNTLINVANRLQPRSDDQ